MRKSFLFSPISMILALPLLAGCGSSHGGDSSSGALNAHDVNLIFAVSEDLAFQSAGDVNPTTANLTSQGLQRALHTDQFLRRRVLGNHNVTAVYALEPMTHLQTVDDLPDLAALGSIQQFALLNQITLTLEGQTSTANSYPINTSYSPSSVPTAVATPTPFCTSCQGLDFADQASDNETLVDGIIKAQVPGYYVFSAPWETVSALMANINRLEGFHLTIPTSYGGANLIYALSVTSAGVARLVTFDTKVTPASSFPTLPSPGATSTPCIAQAHFTISVTIGRGGAVRPTGINTNETAYLIRHAEAHPVLTFEDGNYVCAGQWRALALPDFLRGNINTPDEVFSIDPAQATEGGTNASGDSTWSYVRPTLTIEPYAIANGIPYGLAASYQLGDSDSPMRGADFFFTGGQFTNHTVLVAYEPGDIPPTVNALLASYFSGGGGPAPAPGWPGDDYDTIWTVQLDGSGNLSIGNSLCEGIDSASLPASCPEF